MEINDKVIIIETVGLGYPIKTVATVEYIDPRGKVWASSGSYRRCEDTTTAIIKI